MQALDKIAVARSTKIDADLASTIMCLAISLEQLAAALLKGVTPYCYSYGVHPSAHVNDLTSNRARPRTERLTIMGKSPKRNEELLDRILTAWKTLASEAEFGGMKVDQFEAFIAPSKTTRAQVAALENQLAQAINAREAADEVSLAKVALVVAGVNGDPAFGPNSSLIEAFGYIRKSERRSGLKRSGGGTPPAAPKT